MSLPLQPRTRAALTPTSVGRFPAPSSGARARRGFTPKSASRTKTFCDEPSVKPKLTAEQQLEIIERLESGNFKRGEGLSQFYKEFGSDASKMTCKQNLFSSFASVDPIASSTRNYGYGMMTGSMESLISVGSSVISANTMMSDGADVTTIEAPIIIPANRASQAEEYNNLPEYIILFDKLVLGRENFHRRLEKLAQIQCATKFAGLLPQEIMVSFFKSLDRVRNIITKFLDGNATENMRLFMPTPPSKGPPPPVIHCEAENHSKIINAFYKLSEIMDKLDAFQQEPTDFKLEAKVDSFKDIVNNLEEAIKAQEHFSQEVKEMVKQTENIHLKDETLNDNETLVFEDSPSQ